MNVDPASALPIDAADIAAMSAAESSVIVGRDLAAWWSRAGWSDRASVFPLTAVNASETATGFFTVADLPTMTLPVMGVTQEVVYDNLRREGGTRAAELREFVLRYFLRLRDLRETSAYVPPAAGVSSASVLSWCPTTEAHYAGFGYSQRYYRRAGTHLVGKFRENEQRAIIDLRDLRSAYDWII